MLHVDFDAEETIPRTIDTWPLTQIYAPGDQCHASLYSFQNRHRQLLGTVFAVKLGYVLMLLIAMRFFPIAYDCFTFFLVLLCLFSTGLTSYSWYPNI